MLRQHTFAAYYQYILLKSPVLSVVSDLRNVLSHKQGRLTIMETLIVQLWSFTDNFVHCNTLRSNKTAFLELEKAMFTVTTAVRMLAIITPGR